jgi:hypothetical protein
MLRVFSPLPRGKLIGPIWSSEIKDGLDAPDVVLVRALREAVDRSYPPESASQPASQSGQPASLPAKQPVSQPASQPPAANKQ